MDTETKTINQRPAWLDSNTLKWSAIAGLVVVASLVGLVFHQHWLPQAQAFVATVTNVSNESDAGSVGKKSDKHDHDHEGGDHKGHDHEGHDHDHEGHDEANSLELSDQAKKNVGLTTAVVKLQKFVRYVTVPAMVVGRTGRSEIDVTASLGGRVTRVYPIAGEAVEPGQPLFDLRLTHEELVQAQSNFLRTAEELDVVAREIRRLNSVKVPGAIAGKTVREREYEEQKLKAVFNAQQQSLLLHGLTAEQVDSILKTRTLVQGVTIVAPPHPKNGYTEAPSHPFTVKNLKVRPGQYVDAGATLCQLTDYNELYVEGRAFEQDAAQLIRAAREEWRVTAFREGESNSENEIKDLRIVYVSNEVERDSRALFFYVGLPNRILHAAKSEDGHRFVTWQHRPGQRMQIRVPVEEWSDRIVLPVDAVAKDGVEYYVFRESGHHFDRVPVHVEYEDQFSVVIANDGSISPRDVVATRGAHQLQMALKNKAGGGIDPHAGHNH